MLIIIIHISELPLCVMSSAAETSDISTAFKYADLSTPVHRTSGRDDKFSWIVFIIIILLTPELITHGHVHRNADDKIGPAQILLPENTDIVLSHTANGHD